ncbi:class I SAM-dependent methyltransferase [Oscillospiraceae bacterium MB08-C2-2]|nr:class I SAM-dependent methyltransferase [Oscillospiraceae bacterium MB08-C2-2]
MKEYTALDKRLTAVYELVRSGSRVADIGADHGYLVCALVQRGKCPGGFACDINSQPLEKSRKTIVRAGLSEQIVPVLADGLAGIAPLSVEDIVIAGMGGEQIAAILEQAGWCFDPRYHMVLQPMTKTSFLRRWLCENGFEIHREIPVEQGKFAYTVLSVSWTGQKTQPDRLFQLVGKIPQSQYAARDRYLMIQRDRLRKQAQGLNRGRQGGDEAKQLQELADEIHRLISEK